MGTILARYDASAAAYESWWAPVLRPSALAVLDEVEAGLGRPPVDLLDVGAGTGSLALAALERWPGTAVTALDGSGAMLAVAEGLAAELGAAARKRLTTTSGLADRLPIPDGAMDAVVSSFVMQLVPHRPRALAEARRVLRPGGAFAFVTWLRSDDAPLAPDEAFYDVLDELGIPDDLEPEETRSGDLASVEAAAAQVRRAGFRSVVAREGTLVHRYDPATYLRFLEEYAERETFATFDAAMRRDVRARTAEALGRLPADAFVWRAPIVTLRGIRPG